MSNKVLTSIVLVAGAYIAAQMMADIASLRIVLIAGLSMDGGTLVYPLTFTLRDMVHKVAGLKAARMLIIAAGVINVIMAGLFWLVGRLPADPTTGAQTAFIDALSPVWRIVFASIAAEILAELIDTEIYRLWVEKITKRYQWARVLSSNAVSVPIDSLVFSWAAFGGVLPAVVVWSIFTSNVIIKGITTLISLPGIYLVKENHTT
jgi:queuosine precursor transporter